MPIAFTFSVENSRNDEKSYATFYHIDIIYLLTRTHTHTHWNGEYYKYLIFRYSNTPKHKNENEITIKKKQKTFWYLRIFYDTMKKCT